MNVVILLFFPPFIGSVTLSAVPGCRAVRTCAGCPKGDGVDYFLRGPIRIRDPSKHTFVSVIFSTTIYCLSHTLSPTLKYNITESPINRMHTCSAYIRQLMIPDQVVLNVFGM